MSELGHDAVWLLDHYLRIWDGHNGRLMPDIHMESLRGVRDELVSLRARVAELEKESER